MDRAAIERLFRTYCQSGTAIAAHLPRLRTFARGCALAAELGVKRGASTTALLLEAAHVFSVDLTPTPAARALETLAGDRWTYYVGDSRTAPVPPCDLLFVDSHHSYAHVSAELQAHADKVRRLLIFHDTLTFGSVSAAGENGQHSWQYRAGQSVPREHLGIRPAIDELMIRDPSWRIILHDLTSHGLLVLERA